MDQSVFDQFFRTSPREVDVESIRREWLAIKLPFLLNARRLPKPIWARHGYPEDGHQAWEKLKLESARIDASRAYSLYVHIPFCARKCSFCDCYAFRLGQHASEHIERYTSILEHEMQLWSELGNLAQRPVSTVHFGGGTPLFLGEECFSRLVKSCHQYFNTNSQTEWALETTSSELSNDMFQLLNSLGFTRLHMGVQSLNDPIRETIKRRESKNRVLDKLSKAVALGWVTSVDLIFGLPTQSLANLLNDIHLLTDSGVNGFSLYELQRSNRNRQFIEQNGLTKRDRTMDFFLLQGAAQILRKLGYKKTLFNHYADSLDKDLYFTFPERGEDCLAIGTIADGVLNGYHYRHPEYTPYCQGVNGSFPGLEGGIRQSVQEGRFATLETAILSASLSKEEFKEVLGEQGTNILFGKWSDAALIAEEAGLDRHYTLTTNGSWFAGEMMAQLAENACS
jgi:coproporphyrinogen III oxidase-like Fe-S oxidoreductase